MASKLDIMLEAERRGILPANQQAILQEARKRGMVTEEGMGKSPSASGAPRVPFSVSEPGDTRSYNLNDPADASEYNKQYGERNAQARLAREADKKRIENRPISERALDATVFAGSLPVRIVTGGEKGIGDLAAKVSPSVGESLQKSESDFARANQGALEGIAKAGEVSAGIPVLNTLGAPLKGVGAATRLAINARATAANIANDLPLGKFGRAATEKLNQILQPLAAKPSVAPGAAQPPANIQSLPERLRDMQAMREEGMEFAPSLASKGTARIARTIEELPGVGGTVKSPKTNVELAARELQQGIGRQLGSRGAEEETGALAQRALERYRGSGIEDIDPNALRQQGIAPYQPQRAAQVMSQGAAERLSEAAPIRQAGAGGTAQTSRGAQVPTARPLSQVGLRRTNAEDLSEAQIGRLIRTPSRDTSFQVRAEALYESAWRKIPPMMRADDTANPGRIGWNNLRNALNSVQGEIGSQIAGQNTIAGGLAQRITRATSHTSVGELRSIRTEIGRALSNFGQHDIGLDRTQLKRLYAGASRDMENGLQDLANRTWLRTRLRPTDANYLPESAARRADAALYEFRRADRYTRLGMERMDRFMGILGAKNPNEAVRKIMGAIREGTQNIGMIRELSRVLRPEEWNAVRGHIFETMGRGRPGAKEAESIFNWSHWATDWHKYMGTVEQPTAARGVLLNGLEPAVARRLDNLSRIVNRMKYYESTKNFSGTAYTGAAGIALMSPSVMTTAAALFGSSAIMGKLLTSRAYTAFLENFMQQQMRLGNTLKANTQITGQYARRLSALASKQADPELGRAMQAMSLAIMQSQQEKASQ